MVKEEEWPSVVAYCTHCEKMVEATQMGQPPEYRCPRCSAKIQICDDCIFWGRPLLHKTYGICWKTGERAYALDLACENFEI